VLQVLIQSGRLKWDKKTKEGKLLLEECKHFRAKVNVNTGFESYESWRERDHDDLVLGVALAAWLGERHQTAGTARPFWQGGGPSIGPQTLGRGNGGFQL